MPAPAIFRLPSPSSLVLFDQSLLVELSCAFLPSRVHPPLQWGVGSVVVRGRELQLKRFHLQPLCAPGGGS